MQKEIELWQFIADRLDHDREVMLLVVAESSGSSPGRQGYKMAVAADGEMIGSIGGGVMEVNLVEQSRAILCRSPHVSKDVTLDAELKHQVHRKNDPDSSGMICSGKQTIIFKLLRRDDLEHVAKAVESITEHRRYLLKLSPSEFEAFPPGIEGDDRDFVFETTSETDFQYRETLGPKNELFIIGGGHCSLALSQLMSAMDFRISIFDDRPELNTVKTNRYADEITIIDGFEVVDRHVHSAPNAYVVVMTLGYRSDETVIRKLLDKEFKYFGVLGSRAKMATLLKALREDGFPADKLARIRTPIGLPINSRTPEEIAVSIAAEIISVKNAD